MTDDGHSPSATTLSSSQSPFYIGRFNNSGIESCAKGKIDDVRIYNRALSATEVKKLYNLGTVTIRPQ